MSSPPYVRMITRICGGVKPAPHGAARRSRAPGAHGRDCSGLPAGSAGVVISALMEANSGPPGDSPDGRGVNRPGATPRRAVLRTALLGGAAAALASCADSGAGAVAG